jgi:predicted esterase
MLAWVYIPKRGTPPYQTVVMFPGSGSIGAAASTATPDTRISFVPASGRIAVFPIFKSTHERSDSLRSDIPDKSIFWRDHVVMWVKDYKRNLDYLITRADIDTTKFAYFGYSWGGNMGGSTRRRTAHQGEMPTATLRWSAAGRGGLQLSAA